MSEKNSKKVDFSDCKIYLCYHKTEKMMKKIFFAFGFLLLPIFAACAQNKEASPAPQKTYVKHIDGNDFKELIWDFSDPNNNGTIVYKGDLPCIVDFYTTWCGPCKRIAPIMEELAKEYEGKIKVGKVNTDENMSLSSQFQITSIPCLIIFKNGKAINKMVGFRPKNDIKQEIDNVL